MIAKAQKSYQHRSGVRRRRGTGAKVAISRAAAAIGRRVAIHVGDRQYDVARQVIDCAECEYHASKFRPTSTKDVTLGHMELPEAILGRLYDHRYRDLADLVAANDEDLLAIRQLGPGSVRRIRERCDYWISRIAAPL